MDEWILVQFPQLRAVLLDGTPNGATNKAILVQLGTHVVTLAGVQNYQPPSITCQPVNTTHDKPMILVFTLV
jgi:hypothetical protein